MPFIPLAISSERMEIAVYALGAITVLYVVFRPMLRRKKDPLERLPGLSLSSQRRVERDMQNLLVELSEMARQITAQLDTRSAKLQALIEEADRRLAELNKAAGTAAETPAVEIKPPIGQTPAADQPQAYADIHALADQGRSPREIAQQLGRPIGEIELILALRMK